MTSVGSTIHITVNQPATPRLDAGLQASTDYYIRNICTRIDGTEVVCTIVCESGFHVVERCSMTPSCGLRLATFCAERAARLSLREHLSFLSAHLRTKGEGV